MIGDFHFIRPWWLLAWLPLAALVWAMQRRQDATHAWHGVVAPHLLPFLLSGQAQRRRFSPLLIVALAGFVAVLAIAGPTWQRQPAPFAEDTAALAIVIKVSPSMMTEDVQPSRLARSVQKIQDLLEQRRGAKTALIAYAGSAHVVMPATSDEGIINTFAQALDPKVMPGDGDVADKALQLADQTLADAGGGSILWITDSVATEQAVQLRSWRRKSSTPLRLLPPLLPGSEWDALPQTARVADACVERLTADDSDVASLARAAKFTATTGGELSDHWEESGYWLTPLLAALLLLFFRRGWMLQTAAIR